MNKTEQLFELTAPYNNPYQGTDIKLLFVCSAGLLRSATGANYYAKRGYNTRNCGTHKYALIPLSVNLIAWADTIIFVNEENHLVAMETFQPSDWDATIKEKAVVLDIPDQYEYNHPALIEHFEKQMPTF
jgi:predicted protein tyrosine phosphatase